MEGCGVGLIIQKQLQVIMPHHFVCCGGLWVHIVQSCAHVCAVPGCVCASRGCAGCWSTAGQGGRVNADQQRDACR